MGATVVDGGLATYVPRLLTTGRGRRGAEHWEIDGSLVFADVSGFTRLTERLARQGKAGAEEMVTTISRVFTALLSATEDGGDVLKFGGDALLILYTGADHEVRACHAAQGMQRTLRSVGAIDSSQGRVRLRMSVGIHSGTFPMFLAGEDDALELHVVGQPATCTVEMESAAEAGDILVSPATAAALDPGWLGAAKGGGVLVRRIPPLSPVTVLPEDPPTADVERFIPRLLRGRLGRSSEEHEHRRVAISFVHFGGVDRLIADRGTPAAFERVDALTRAVQAAADEFGVLVVCTDIGGDGGKFMLAAGAPDATEDDEGRLLRAARRMVTADVGLPVRAGVNHGHVFAGDVGAPFRRTYSTMGDAVNLAARVMGKAPFGEVLATRGAVGAATGRFRTEAVPPFSVKGKTRPVDALLVRDPVAVTPPRLDGADLPLVGRRAVLAALGVAVAAARAGDGPVVELVGDVGAGKSRLVAELTSANPDLPVASAAGDPYGQAAAYHVANTLLRRLLHIPAGATAVSAGRALTDVVERRAPDLLPWLPLLAVPIGAEVAPTPQVDATTARYRGQRMRAAVADLVAAIGPTSVVVVEAVEHVDEASADLLGHVLAQVSDRDWLTVLTRRADVPRPAWCDLDGLVRLELPPLSREDAEAFVARASEQHPIPSHLVDPIVERAAGNPLFLLELVRSSADGGPSVELPASVEAIIASGLDALAPDDRQALRFLSVLGTRAPHGLVDLALGELGVRSDDRRLWARVAAFVERTDTDLSFRGPLARQVAYEGLTYRRRRDLHGRVADVLLSSGATRDGVTDGEDLSSVAWHLEQAGRWGEAWPAAVAAGDAARAAYANAEAVAAYRRALAAAEHLEDVPPDELAEIAERCGDTCEVTALYPEAAAAYRVARRTATTDDRCVRLLRKQGVLEERVGRYTLALRWYGRALRIAEGLPPDDADASLAELHNAYAGVRYRQGRLRDCVSHALRGAEHAARAGQLPDLAHAYYLLDAAYTDLDEQARATRYRDLALPFFERAGDLIGQANVLNNLGIDAFFARDLAGARELYERSREARLAAGDVVGAATADHNIAEILIEEGTLDEAEALLRRALRAYRGARYALGIGYATSNLGVVAAKAGRLDEATERLTDALAIFRELGSTSFVEETESRLAELARTA